MIKALLLSEWRRLRGTILMTVAVTLGIWILLFCGKAIFNWQSWFELARICMLILIPIIYSIAFGFDAFNERIRGHMSFLQGLPINNDLVYWLKYGSGALLMLALIAVNSEIAMRWSPLSPAGKPWEGEANAWIFVAHIAMLALLVHAFCFLASLFGPRTQCSIVFFIALPLLLALSLPGNMLVGQLLSFQPRFDMKPFLLWKSLGAAAVVAWIFLLVMGWHLWRKCIAVGLSPVKTAWIDVSILLAFSWLTFCGFYAYAHWQLTAARSEAIAAGLVVDAAGFAPPAPDVPDQQTALYWLNQVNPRIAKTLSDQHVLFRNVMEFRFNDDDRNRIVANRQQCAEVLLDSDVARAINGAIDNALEQSAFSSCRHVSNYELFEAYDGGKEEKNINNACRFLQRQAIAAAINNRPDIFFSNLKKAEKMADFILQRPIERNKDAWLHFHLDICLMALMIGPNDSFALPHYRAMLAKLDKLQIKTNNGLSMPIIRIEYATGTPILRELLRPYALLRTAASIRGDMLVDKLMPEIEKISSYHEANTKYRHIINTDDYYGGTAKTFWLFFFRSEVAQLRLGLALKIYRIEHGRFPDTLDALIPDLLPSIPCDAINGRALLYQKKLAGFVLYRTDRPEKDNKYKLLDYQPLPTYNINMEKKP